MFVLQSNPTWTWPVIVNVPGDDGDFVQHQFRARFRLVDLKRFETLGLTVEGTETVMKEAVVELLDIVGADGQPIRHSDDLLHAVLRNPWLRGGLVRAYAGAISGQPSAAALGN